jgi:hypothetical protein
MAAFLDITTARALEAKDIIQTGHTRKAASVAPEKLVLGADVASQYQHNQWNSEWEKIVNEHQGKEPYKHAAVLLISWDNSNLDVEGKVCRMPKSCRHC